METQEIFDSLIRDLLVLKDDKRETPYRFGMRCRDARCIINSKINMTDMSRAEKTIRIKSYNDLALETFIRSLPNTIQTNLRLRNANNLEVTLGYLMEEENFLYASKQNDLNQNIYNPVTEIVTSSKSGFNYCINRSRPVQERNLATVPALHTIRNSNVLRDHFLFRNPILN